MSGQADGRNTGFQVESFGSPNVSSEKSEVRSYPSFFRNLIKRGLMTARHMTYISKLILHPSKVLEVQIKKENINPKAGQYIFISCPEISYLQYHPFTLTSAPEEDYVSVHMRIVGDWTSVCSPVSLGSGYSPLKTLTYSNSLSSPIHLRFSRSSREADDRHSLKLSVQMSTTMRKKARKA